MHNCLWVNPETPRSMGELYSGTDEGERSYEQRHEALPRPAKHEWSHHGDSIYYEEDSHEEKGDDGDEEKAHDGAESALPAKTFPAFMRLPPEIRAMIWNCTFPNHDPPALYFFGSRNEYEAIPGQLFSGNEVPTFPDDVHNEPNQVFVPVQTPMPQAFYTHHESRNIGKDWAERKGIKVHKPRSSSSQILIREFNIVHDILYIPPSKWLEFVANEGMSGLNLINHPHKILQRRAQNIAIPAAMLQDWMLEVVQIMIRFPRPHTWTVVFDVPPDFDESEKQPRLPARWELQRTLGQAELSNVSWVVDGDGFSAGQFEFERRGQYLFELDADLGMFALREVLECIKDKIATVHGCGCYAVEVRAMVARKRVDGELQRPLLPAGINLDEATGMCRRVYAAGFFHRGVFN